MCNKHIHWLKRKEELLPTDYKMFNVYRINMKTKILVFLPPCKHGVAMTLKIKIKSLPQQLPVGGVILTVAPHI